jgi:hypothetical protein
MRSPSPYRPSVSFQKYAKSDKKRTLKCFKCGGDHYRRKCTLDKPSSWDTTANAALASGYFRHEDITADPDSDHYSYAAVVLPSFNLSPHVSVKSDDQLFDVSSAFLHSKIDDHVNVGPVIPPLYDTYCACTDLNEVIEYIKVEFAVDLLEPLVEHDCVVDLLDAGCSFFHFIGQRRALLLDLFWTASDQGTEIDYDLHPTSTSLSIASLHEMLYYPVSDNGYPNKDSEPQFIGLLRLTSEFLTEVSTKHNDSELASIVRHRDKGRSIYITQRALDLYCSKPNRKFRW